MGSQTETLVAERTFEDELREMAEEMPDRFLPASVVVDRARDETAYPLLHAEFEWNDRKVAYEARLQVARQLLMHVTITTPERKEMRMFVSLSTDRVNEGGGYRVIDDVLAAPDDRKQHAEDIMKRILQIARDYWYLTELTPVYDAIYAATKKVKY